MLSKNLIVKKKGLNILLIILSMSLILLNTFYIIFTQINQAEGKICQAVGVLLHFFLINSLFLMVLIPIYTYHMYVDSNASSTCFNRIGILIVFGKIYFVINLIFLNILN